MTTLEHLILLGCFESLLFLMVFRVLFNIGAPANNLLEPEMVLIMGDRLETGSEMPAKMRGRFHAAGGYPGRCNNKLTLT